MPELHWPLNWVLKQWGITDKGQEGNMDNLDFILANETPWQLGWVTEPGFKLDPLQTEEQYLL